MQLANDNPIYWFRNFTDANCDNYLPLTEIDL